MIHRYINKSWYFSHDAILSMFYKNHDTSTTHANMLSKVFLCLKLKLSQKQALKTVLSPPIYNVVNPTESNLLAACQDFT